MGFQAILQQFLSEGSAHQASTFQSLTIFLPELVLSCSIVLMLLARLIDLDKILPTHWIALVGAVAAFGVTLFQFWQMTLLEGASARVEIFTGLAIHDEFSIFFRGFLAFFLMFVIVLTVLAGIPMTTTHPILLAVFRAVDKDADVDANHMLMMFLAEDGQVPS